MTIRLPSDLENSLRTEILSGHFATPDDAVAEIVRDYFRRKGIEATSTAGVPEANGGLGINAGLGDDAELLNPAAQQANGVRQNEPLTERDFKQRLLAAGLMISFPTPPDSRARPVFEPVTIEGEPLSETIIRERR